MALEEGTFSSALEAPSTAHTLPRAAPPEVGEGTTSGGLASAAGRWMMQGLLGQTIPVEVEGTWGLVQVGNSKRHAEL